MRTILRSLAVAAVSAAVAGAALRSAAPGSESGQPGATLAVREGGRWVIWWRQDSAPVRWDGRAPLATRVAWRAGQRGVEWGELPLRGTSEAWRTRVVLVRLDPRQVALSLAPAFTEDRRWTVDDAPVTTRPSPSMPGNSASPSPGGGS